MGKINYRTDDINKKLKQIDELVGSNNNLSNQINNFNSQLDTITNVVTHDISKIEGFDKHNIDVAISKIKNIVN